MKKIAATDSNGRPIAWYVGPTSAIKKIDKYCWEDSGPLPKGVWVKVRRGYKLVNTLYKYSNYSACLHDALRWA
ncbi:MAG: hypothetical protein QMD22_11310 [archaeon]|nr:hypothetical protein [archaeon]